MSWKAMWAVTAGLIVAITAARVLQDPDTGTSTWDSTRAAGFASYLLLWVSVVTGIAIHMRWRPGSAALTWVFETHRITSTLALAFVLAHVWALLLDPVVHFDPVDAVIPFTSDFRPFWVGIGTLAMWLTIAVLASTAAASRFSYNAWHNVHYLSFPAYALSLLHGLTSGTDSQTVPALLLYATTGGILAGVAVWRIAGREYDAAPDRDLATS